MRRVIVLGVVSAVLATSIGCKPSSDPIPPAKDPVPAVVPPPVPDTPPTAKALTADRVAGKTFIYNHQLVDGSLDGATIRLTPEGKLTGITDQTLWKVEDGVLNFMDENGAVRSRFDKVYTGPAGLFFLGHRTNDNKYHTLLELPPTK